MKFFAAAGIRDGQDNPLGFNNPPVGARFPCVAIFGPSGQAVQVGQPSGLATRQHAVNTDLQAFEQTFNHASIKFFKNQLMMYFRDGGTTADRRYCFGWRPQPQNDVLKVNDVTYNPLGGQFSDLGNRIMFDGSNWEHWGWIGGGADLRNMGCFPREFPASAGAWIINEDIGGVSTITQGYHQGHVPFFKIDGSANNGYQPRAGEYSMLAFGPHSRLGFDNAPGGLSIYAGSAKKISPAFSRNFCDSIWHKDQIWLAWNNAVATIRPGLRGKFLFSENTTDEFVDDTTETSSYQVGVRFPTNKYGNNGKCFAVHNDVLYMLQNDGKVYRCDLQEVVEIADLATLGTPWSSGIIGGALPQLPLATAWAGTAAKRCFLASFNKQLHAFLNFSTNFKVAKGNNGALGNGIFWATSFDGINWTDFSPCLPTSGIVTASGGGGARLVKGPSAETIRWTSKIAPYRFSSFGPGIQEPNQNGDYPEIYDTQEIGSTVGTGLASQVKVLGQAGSIPYWASGSLLDAPGTLFQNLKTPLQQLTQSGIFLFPTLIRYPKDFLYVSPSLPTSGLPKAQGGVLRPSGIGPSGYDYSGMDQGYHITGYADRELGKLSLLVSEDYRGPNDTLGQSALYELDTASGWKMKNYMPHVNQFNSFIPIDLYTPEITIVSGHPTRPNPFLDEKNSQIRIKYRIHDWLFWDKIKVIVEYSLDNRTWNKIATIDDVSSGTKLTDPSGHLGGPEQEFIWNYTQGKDALSKHTFYPRLLFRMRGIGQ